MRLSRACFTISHCSVHSWSTFRNLRTSPPECVNVHGAFGLWLASSNAPSPVVLACAARALTGLVKSNPGSYFVAAWRHRLPCSSQRGLGATTLWAYLLERPPCLPLPAISAVGQIIRSSPAARFSLRPAFTPIYCIQSFLPWVSPAPAQVEWAVLL